MVPVIKKLNQFCEWLVGKGMLDRNPMQGYKKMRESAKYREQLSPEMLRLLRIHLGARVRR